MSLYEILTTKNSKFKMYEEMLNIYQYYLFRNNNIAVNNRN